MVREAISLKAYALCTVETGINTLRLLADKVPLAGIIGLADRQPTDGISGYVHMAPYAEELGCKFLPINNYTLSDPGDKEKLLALDIDVLFVSGWQRLIPKWLINHCRFGAIGAHGSANGISGGRGRSPQNWALILGAKTFQVSIFFIDEGVDNGRVIATREFELTEQDDIRSSYGKVSTLVAEMIVEAFNNGAIESGKAIAQPLSGYYLPQRLPEDGGIDWTRTTAEIDRFVRGLTRPYPGAFSMLNTVRVTVWKVRSCDDFQGFSNRAPGKILRKFDTGELLVATGDGALVIGDHSVQPEGEDTKDCVGNIFSSVDFVEQIRTIVTRHQDKYSDFELSPEILRAAKLK